MSIVGSVEVRVDTDVMVAQAENVRQLANDMKRKFDIIEDLVNKSQYYWIGEAGDLHRKMFFEQKENIDLMLRRLLEHPNDLIAIATNYEVAERENISVAQALPIDIIQ